MIRFLHRLLCLCLLILPLAACEPQSLPESFTDETTEPCCKRILMDQELLDMVIRNAFMYGAICGKDGTNVDSALAAATANINAKLK